MSSIDLKNIFVLLSEQIKLDYDKIAENIPHYGERGMGREQILKKLLSNYLPQRFGVDSGFIIDVHGAVSKQVDLIIYDRFIGPRFKISGDKYAYPCEIVVAAGEVKTHLGKRELVDAVEKLVAISRLDRTGGGRNRVRMGYHFMMNEEHLDPVKNASDAIWTFIFASRSVELETLAKTLVQVCKDTERYLWPNLICVLNAGIVSYASATGLITDPRNATDLYYTTEEEAQYALLKWFMLLNQAACNNQVTTIDTINYLRSKQSKSIRLPIA